jgi:hypothetical protein
MGPTLLGSFYKFVEFSVPVYARSGGWVKDFYLHRLVTHSPPPPGPSPPPDSGRCARGLRIGSCSPIMRSDVSLALKLVLTSHSAVFASQLRRLCLLIYFTTPYNQPAFYLFIYFVVKAEFNPIDDAAEGRSAAVEAGSLF